MPFFSECEEQNKASWFTAQQHCHDSCKASKKVLPRFPTATPPPPKESVTGTAWCAKN